MKKYSKILVLIVIMLIIVFGIYKTSNKDILKSIKSEEELSESSKNRYCSLTK